VSALASFWVKPGCGDSVGYLYDRVLYTGALAQCEYAVRAEWAAWVGKGLLTREQREKRTRLHLSAIKPVQPYDVERVIVAIWDLDGLVSGTSTDTPNDSERENA
jgi:hypothetical protein